jgi:hypothetical protein
MGGWARAANATAGGRDWSRVRVTDRAAGIAINRAGRFQMTKAGDVKAEGWLRAGEVRARGQPAPAKSLAAVARTRAPGRAS